MLVLIYFLHIKFNYRQQEQSLMAAIKIDGLKYARQFTKRMAQKILIDKKIYNFPQQSYPRLALLLVGDNPASLSYIKRKKKYASKALIKSRLFQVQLQSQNGIVQKVKNTITKLNKDEKYNGIILQLPVHKKVNKYEKQFLNLISCNKDVDCLGDQRKNIFQKQGKLAKIKPCVVAATYNIFQNHNIDYKNKSILLIGEGKLTGAPLKQCFQKQNCNVITFDKTSSFQQIRSHALNSDIIISATGQPNNLKQNQLKKGCVIIDIGISPDPKNPGEVRGDFDQSVKKNVCSFYTPVPKGIGPMVVTSLLSNTYQLWLEQMFKKYKK